MPAIPTARAFPKLRLLTTPSQKRETEVIANQLKQNLGIDVAIETKDFPVLIE